MKIAFIPLTNDINNPTDRLRCFEIIIALQKKGFDIGIYDGSRDYDILVIQNRNFNRYLSLVKENKKNNKITIFDVSDNIIKPIPAGQTFFAKLIVEFLYFFKKICPNLADFNKTISFLQSCDYITVGSYALRKEIIKYNRNCYVISDPVELSKKIKTSYKIKKRISLVWTGYKDNVPYLFIINKVLKKLAKKYDIIFNVITSKSRNHPYRGILDNRILIDKLNCHTQFTEWKLSTCNHEIIKNDIAVVPLPQKTAKSVNKITTFMTLGLPVVVSNNFEYRTVIKNEENGLIASNSKEWYSQLDKLIKDVNLRKKLAIAGYHTAQSEYSIKSISQKWVNFFRKVYDEKNCNNRNS